MFELVIGLVPAYNIPSNCYIIPGNTVRNFFRRITFNVGPKICAPNAVIRFLSRTTLLVLKRIHAPSFLVTSLAVLTNKPRALVFFFNQLFGLVAFMLTLTKLPTELVLREPP